jgi:hypothetical protein
MRQAFKKKAIIVDVDGTLADMRGVRGPFEWDKVGKDKPHTDIINLVKDLQSLKEGENPKYAIIIVTGRDGECKQATIDWLFDVAKLEYWDDFYIRPAGSFEKDSIIKSRIYMDHIRPEFDVEFVIDDRDQVVDMWRSLGLRVLQVAEGKF